MVGGDQPVTVQFDAADTVATGTYGVDETITAGAFTLSEIGKGYTFVLDKDNATWYVKDKVNNASVGSGSGFTTSDDA
ncbi:MAG: hypothetical protein AAF840_19330, partial [Bacteroidota bacterium]